MKNCIIVLAAVAAAARPLAARADMNAIRQSDSDVSLEAGFSRFLYKETVAGSLFDSEHKWLPTATLSARVLAADNAYGPFQNLYLELRGQAAIGTATYNGALQDGTPFNGSTAERIQELTGRIGHGFDLFGAALLIPFGEIGYRYWARSLQGQGGYDEDYSNGEVMLGLLAQVSPLPHLVLSVEGAAGQTFGGSMTAGQPVSATFGLGDKPTWRVGGKLGYAVSPRLEITGGLQYEQLQYGASNLVQTGLGPAFEPDSRTRETTLQIGLSYHFF
jgi:hypothetical protein